MEQQEPIKKKYSFAIISSLFINITFFLFEPVKNYLANSEEYWFTLNRALPYYISFTIMGIVLCILVYLLISCFNMRLADKTCEIICIITVGMYVQSNVLPNTNGVLNGHPVDWSEINVDRVCSGILWIIIIVLLIVISLGPLKKKDLSSGLKTIAICFLLLEISVCAYLFIKVPNINYKYEYAITDIDECNLSNKENFIIFITDAFDSSYMEGQIEDNRAEALFEDFTYYSNVTSMYGHTDLSIPQIITGCQYKNERSYKDYLIDAYTNSPLLNRLNDSNWSIGLYFEGHLPKCDFLSNIINVADIECDFSSRKHFVISIYKLVAYTVSPYELKKIFWFEPDFSNLKDTRSDDYDLYLYLNGAFYEDEEVITFTDEQPAFRLYHTRGMHLPMHTTSDVIEQYDSVSMEECREANYKIFERMIDALKAEGVYDNSVVIIMADHGESSDETGEWQQNPVLMIKGKNEHHAFEECSIPFSYENLQEMYLNLLNGNNGLDAFDGIDITEGKSRIFYRYMYGHETLGSETFPEITEYITDGHASDISGFKPTGNIYFAE